ncbi:hypothetical protein [Halobaculum sp. P14]|uniref:hypothetical protein n=1 Tax=Halobaculum sp. P14 TaxID=3421638 RepID=UPI003EB7664D
MISFDRDGDDVVVRDRIEEVLFRVDVGGAASEPTDTDQFTFPVDSAVRVETDTLAFNQLVTLYVRRDGSLLDTCSPGGTASVSDGTFEIEVSSAPMKLSIRLPGPFRVEDDGERTRIAFDGAVTVRIGARSFHGHPAGSVTVPETPRGMMRAVSTFGSALATTSPERSFPTLRGHPPLVEFGGDVEGDVDVPEFAEPPDTGVRITVPETWGDVYAVATLAYYLGAEVVPGDDPAVRAAGETYSLSDGRLATEAQRLLEHVFLLDCVVRTEGFYDVDLHERRVVEERVDVDPARLYGLPLDERVAEYLRIPVEPLSDVLDWHLTADVKPAVESAELLPFLVNDMAAIRDATVASEADDGADDAAAGLGDGTAVVPGESSPAGERVVTPPPADTVGHIWVGDGYPVGASKPTVGAYRRRLDETVSESSVIDVTVVCNEAEMREETENLYGFRDYLEFDIDIVHDLTVDELRETLADEHDFFHFVGHVDAEGMKCDDGYLDLDSVDDTGVKAFLLNACASYRQGMALVEAGAIGGLVTTTDVGNTTATNTGRTMARLLDYGFDLHGVLDVAKEVHVFGGAYSVVGDAGVTLCQAKSGTPILLNIDSREKADGGFAVDYSAYSTRNYGVGSIYVDFFTDGGVHHLVGSEPLRLTVSRERLRTITQQDRTPVILDYELSWSDEIDYDEI